MLSPNLQRSEIVNIEHDETTVTDHMQGSGSDISNGRLSSPQPLYKTASYEFAAYLYSSVFRREPTTILESRELFDSMSTLDVAEFSLVNLRTKLSARIDIFATRQNESLTHAFNHFENEIRTGSEEILRDSNGGLLLVPLRTATKPPSQPILAAGPRGVLALSSLEALYHARLPFTPRVEHLLLALPTLEPSSEIHVFRFPRAPEPPIRLHFKSPSDSSPDQFSALIRNSGHSLEVTEIVLERWQQSKAETLFLFGELCCDSERLTIRPKALMEPSGIPSGVGLCRWCLRDDQIGAISSIAPDHRPKRNPDRQALHRESTNISNHEDCSDAQNTVRLDRNAIERLLNQHQND